MVFFSEIMHKIFKYGYNQNTVTPENDEKELNILKLNF